MHSTRLARCRSTAVTSEAAASEMIEEREDASVARRARSRARPGALLIYAALLIWTFIALFPLYWTFSTSFKLGRDVTQGHLIPWVDFVAEAGRDGSRSACLPTRSLRPRTCATNS